MKLLLLCFVFCIIYTITLSNPPTNDSPEGSSENRFIKVSKAQCILEKFQVFKKLDEYTEYLVTSMIPKPDAFRGSVKATAKECFATFKMQKNDVDSTDKDEKNLLNQIIYKQFEIFDQAMNNTISGFVRRSLPQNLESQIGKIISRLGIKFSGIELIWATRAKRYEIAELEKELQEWVEQTNEGFKSSLIFSVTQCYVIFVQNVFEACVEIHPASKWWKEKCHQFQFRLNQELAIMPQVFKDNYLRDGVKSGLIALVDDMISEFNKPDKKKWTDRLWACLR